MKRLRMAAVALAVLVLSGCGEWVNIEGGCNQTEVDQANSDLAIIGQMGVVACTSHGAGKFEGEFRCDGDMWQAKCSG